MSEDSIPTNDLSTSMQTVPVLPLRDVVVYPHMVIPLFVGREKSIQALGCGDVRQQANFTRCAKKCRH